MLNRLPLRPETVRARRRKVRRVLLGVVALLALVVSLSPEIRAQVFTGGSAVSITQWIGSAAPTVGQKTMAASLPVTIASDQGNVPHNTAQINGVTPLMGNGVTGTGSQRVTIASDNTAFSVNAVQSGTFTVQPGNTANTTPWLVKSTPASSCGTTQFSSAWAAVPTANTAVTATTTCVTAILLTNTNATAQTVAITDGQGSPITILPTLSINGNSSVVVPMFGSVATTGLKWIAGGTGVTGAVVGLQ